MLIMAKRFTHITGPLSSSSKLILIMSMTLAKPHAIRKTSFTLSMQFRTIAAYVTPSRRCKALEFEFEAGPE